jgi:hypothetical protein
MVILLPKHCFIGRVWHPICNASTSGIQGVKLGEIVAGCGPDLGVLRPPRSEPHLSENGTGSDSTQIWANITRYADITQLSGCEIWTTSGADVNGISVRYPCHPDLIWQMSGSPCTNVVTLAGCLLLHGEMVVGLFWLTGGLVSA